MTDDRGRSQENGPMGSRSSSEGDEWVKQLSGLCGPGAGLRHVDIPMAEIDSMFDSIFAPADEPVGKALSPHARNPIRLYGSNEDILDAYYIFIHPYFPILPPPVRLPVCSRPQPRRVSPFYPSNGLGLAIAAILVLIPHPDENDAQRAEYVRVRRDFAHCFAKSALEAIESEYEPLRACEDPSNPSAEGVRVFDREPFHPKVPPSIEGVIALSILSVYEYAQRGNMNEMLHRANQALALAMSLSLHETMDEDEFAEARRRTWWMTGWKLLVEAQQAILESATFARDLDDTIKTQADPAWISPRMVALDSQIASLLLACREAPPVSQMAPSSGSPEYVASTTMRAFAEIKLHTARIKIHRLCAFQDLTNAPTSQTCARDRPVPPPIDVRAPSSPSDINLDPMPAPDVSVPSGVRGLRFPFAADVSSKICLHAALNTVTLLDNLPYPNPAHETARRAQTARLELPRTMPTLVCCATQAGYALLMLCLKARGFQETEAGVDGLRAPSLAEFRSDVQQSLRLVVKLVGNYALAFEALQGIRDELAQAIDREFSE
ncbi:predicted protein [Aspergillus terreus NIH2624]|uniref:Transcription factor domain-containing protein n=1 Tax=Aspergillus terreus (strain NIH 2624 / FGSC A1156) TaxID=341663 RepID=Q0CPL4_ASPTN|nr:uncharacterized protein ATEG_04370 [Aspergillus terreus NIH2624]EAU34817.1 predicted protein [Aspergillus terreus NIH2624]